ncbi:tRNA uridine(34) 5-carboxymethylaminomethyl modification radical SAM/GNAT enzyme Elp3 [Candidatus Peregrinibacteria bacterium]|nr:tRNA uridine(34) 5-carboxymethylaminomethyl modification radical SAM/GNAT enzyme Elp3 [Candidatus Peregrinibacteria bacterium]
MKPAIKIFGNEREIIAESIIIEMFQCGEVHPKKLEDIKNTWTKGKNISSPSNVDLLKSYRKLVGSKKIPETPWLQKKLRKRSIRTLSGISPISVLTKPYPCPGRCVYCPTEKASPEGKTLFEIDSEKKYGPQKIAKKYRRPGALVMPKSYLSSEPAAMKALLNSFDPWKQVQNRIRALKETGHFPEKCELIVIGGTFSFLPKKYQTWFVKRCVQALNEDKSPHKRIEKVLQENEKAQHRAIGIVLETRPDHITLKEAKRFRFMGCTRVEIGVQTLDDAVSLYTKRGHGNAEVIRATKILRDAGYKICYHMMPGLPGSTPQKDLQSFQTMYSDPNFKPDYLKIYPCSVVPFSELAEWYAQGKFTPATHEDLIPLLLDIKAMTPPWVRITRLIRDIPSTAILAGSKITNLRQHLSFLSKKRGTPCKCIRCREIRDEKFNPEEIILKRMEYEANDGHEIFLSHETPNGKIIALLRLRIPSWFFSKNPGKPLFRVLKNCALIRELHTYGELVPVGKRTGNSQHGGWGKKLLFEAEKIIDEEYHIPKVAVISGVGAKDYYRKFGYEEEQTYMVKKLIKKSRRHHDILKSQKTVQNLTIP